MKGESGRITWGKLFWLINYNSKTKKWIKPKLRMIRAWSPLLKL